VIREYHKWRTYFKKRLQQHKDEDLSSLAQVSELGGWEDPHGNPPLTRNSNDVGGPTVKPAAPAFLQLQEGPPPPHTEDMQTKETGQFSLPHSLPSSFTAALAARYSRVTYSPGTT